jgi:hypothetical protein
MSTKPNVNGIDPLVEKLMADEHNYWLTIDTSQDDYPYITCLVRHPDGVVTIKTYGTTVAKAVNTALGYYSKGFSDTPLWLERPDEEVPPNIDYSPLDRVILEQKGWIIAQRDGPIINTFVGLGWDYSGRKPRMIRASDRQGPKFSENYILMEQDVAAHLAK